MRLEQTCPGKRNANGKKARENITYQEMLNPQ